MTKSRRPADLSMSRCIADNGSLSLRHLGGRVEDVSNCPDWEELRSESCSFRACCRAAEHKQSSVGEIGL